MTYGCNNRKPIVTFGATACQYTKSGLGASDKRCHGCRERQSTGGVTVTKYKIEQKGNKWSDCA